MAASAPISREFDDLSNCSVCFEYFNYEANKPKFLSCRHTICLDCVKVIRVISPNYKDFDFYSSFPYHLQAMTLMLAVICPICRKNTQLEESNAFELPDNYYILQMMDNKKSSSLCPPEPATNLYV